MASKGNNITAVEITDSHVKLIEAKVSREGKLISSCDIKRLSAFSDEEVIKILSGMSVPLKGRLNNVIGIIPRRFAILKHFSFPSHNADEINKMLNLQIVHEVPYPKDEIVFDHTILEKEASGYAKVLAIIVRKEIARHYLKLLTDAGMAAGRLTLSSIGVLYWFNHQREKLNLSPQDSVVVVNIDEVNTELCFCCRNNLFFSRSINLGSKDFNAENLPNFIKQIQLTLGTYKRENMGPEVSKILLVSSISQLSVLKEKLMEEFKLPVETATPVDNLPVAKGFDIASLIGDGGLTATAGLGVILGDSGQLINLIPADFHLSKIAHLQKKQWFNLGVSAASVVVLLMVSFFVDVYSYSNRLKKLQDKSAELKPQAEEARKKIGFFNFINEKFKNRILAAELFSELYKLTPEDISFQSVYIEEDRLTLHGYAKAGSSINDFQNKLVNSPIFKDVSLQYSTKLKIFNEELTDFKMSCRLLKAAL